MFKKLSLIGALCIGLMALGGTDANAYPPRLGGWSWSPGSIVFESTWLGVGNFENNPTEYSVKLIPDLTVEPLTVFFRNPGGGTGGVSVNFNEDSVSITGGSILDPTDLAKNGKVNDNVAFADCPGIDNPTGECGNAEDGALWLLWFDEFNDSEYSCESTTELEKINCVKEYLSFMYAPNPGWVPYAISTIQKFDAIVEAYTDLNNDGGLLDEVVHADFDDCTLNTTGDEYICDVTIWRYKNSDPKGYCDLGMGYEYDLGHNNDGTCP